MVMVIVRDAIAHLCYVMVFVIMSRSHTIDVTYSTG